MTTEFPNQVIRASEHRLFAQRSFHPTDLKNDKQMHFSVVTYNTLLDAALLNSPAYEYCDKTFKARAAGSHRHQLLLEELEWLNSDILCLQEVDESYFDSLLNPALSKLGYNGYFVTNGIATFFKTEEFEFLMKKEVNIFDKIQELCKENHQEGLIDHLMIPTKLLIMVLRHKASNKLLISGNTHIEFDWYGHSVRQILAICLACKLLHEFKETVEAMYQKQDLPFVFCGDFNIEPQFPAYKVVSSGELEEDDLKALETTDYIKYYKNSHCPAPETNKISEKEHDTLCHLNKYFVNCLKTTKSTYKTVLGQEPKVTNHEGVENHWVLDYLWYSPESLVPTGVLDVVQLSVLDGLVGLPNEFFPSDHLSLKACYQFIN